MPTMVKVRPWTGIIKLMDIEELDALYTKPIDDRVKRAIEELVAAIKLTVKTGIEYHTVKRELDERLLWGWNEEDEDDVHPACDGTWKAWERHYHKTVRVKALRAAEKARRTAESATAA